MLMSGLNTLNQSVMNAANVALAADTTFKDRQFAHEMYDIQRAHNLEDWWRQNEYNLPSAQMQRLKDAGLNPNLVYGHGADATATSLPNQAQTHAVRGNVPRFDSLNVLGDYLSVLRMQKDLELADAQINNINADADLKRRNTDLTTIKTSDLQFDLRIKSLSEEMYFKLLNNKVFDSEYDNFVKSVMTSTIGAHEFFGEWDYTTNDIDPFSDSMLIRSIKMDMNKYNLALADAVSMIALNRARAVEAFAHSNTLSKQAELFSAMTGKTLEESRKIVFDIDMALFNANTKMFKSLSNIYGTSVVGNVLNLFNGISDLMNDNATYKDYQNLTEDMNKDLIKKYYKGSFK